jgi:hypothetical protein
MELKDTAVALAGIAVVMLAPGYFTEGTGQPVRIERANVKNGTVSAEFRLTREQ